MIVVDTNLIALAVLPGEREALAILASERDPDWIAPALWRFELSNFLTTAMRVRGLPLALAIGSFEAAERLVVDADLALSIGERLEVALRGRVSAYDAEFVAVAEKLQLRLVTDDRKLAKAFPRSVVLLAEFAAGG